MQEPTEVSKTELIKKSINIALNILRQELSSCRLKDDGVFPTREELNRLTTQFSFDYKAWANSVAISVYVKSRLLFLIEAAKSYLESKQTISCNSSSSEIDFYKIAKFLPPEVWHLIFSYMSKIDLAMLQHANAYFKKLVAAFKKTRDYKLLIMDHIQNWLPPGQKRHPITKNLEISGLLIEVVSPNNFLLLLNLTPYVYDTNSDKCYPLFLPNEQYSRIHFTASNHYDELYLGSYGYSVRHRPIQIYRLDENGIYAKLQTLNTPLDPDQQISITVINRDKFVVYGSNNIYLCQKTNQGIYDFTQAWEDTSITRSIMTINNEDLLMRRSFCGEQPGQYILEVSILRQAEQGRYNTIQRLEGFVDNKIQYVIRINPTEFLLNEAMNNEPSTIKIFKKNVSGLYDVTFQKTFNNADFTILRNEDLLVTSHLLETYQKTSVGYRNDRVTTIAPTENITVANALVFENDDADLLLVNRDNLCVKKAGSNSIDLVERFSGPMTQRAMNSCGILLFYSEERITSLIFRNADRVLRQFAIPKMSAKSILRRLENAILFSKHGATDRGAISFFHKRVIAVGDKDIVVHPIMEEILKCMTEAKKSIASHPVLSAEGEDQIYAKAILEIKSIIMKYNGESVKSRLYLFSKLIDEFEKNVAAHADDLVDDTVVFGYQDENCLLSRPFNSSVNF